MLLRDAIGRVSQGIMSILDSSDYLCLGSNGPLATDVINCVNNPPVT